jgi:hypothetical protein
MMPMDLLEGDSDATVAANVQRLIAQGRSEPQAIAIANARAGRDDLAPSWPELLTLFDRIAITGEPRCGKTTLSDSVESCPVVHTDPNDIQALYPDDINWEDSQEVWEAAPAFVGQMLAGRDRFVVEGVTVSRALRKGTANVDAVVWCDEPRVTQNDGQKRMGAAVRTIFAEWQDANPDVPVFNGNLMVDQMRQRYVVATLDAASIMPTPQKGIRVKARVTKVGVFDYIRNGVLVRELRPAEEVLNPASYMTLKGATVVVDHPYEDNGVNPENFQDLVVGHGEDPEVDGDTITMWLVINDQWAIDEIRAGRLKDVSCGYLNIFEETAGIAPGGKEFDRIQRRIVYNHISLLPPGKGRQGADIGLTLDAADNQLLAVPAAAEPKETPMKVTTKQGAAGATGGKPVTTQDADPNPAVGAPAAGGEAAPGAAQPQPSALTEEQIGAVMALLPLLPLIKEMTDHYQAKKAAEAAEAAAMQAPAAAAPAAPAAAPAAAPSTDNAGAAPAAAPAADPTKQTMDAAQLEELVATRAASRAALIDEARPYLPDDFDLVKASERKIRETVILTNDAKDSIPNSDEGVDVAYRFALRDLRRKSNSLSSLGGTRRFEPHEKTETNDADDKQDDAAPELLSGAYEAWRTPAEAQS